MRAQSALRLIAVLSVALLAACGGGGDAQAPAAAGAPPTSGNLAGSSSSMGSAAPAQSGSAAAAPAAAGAGLPGRTVELLNPDNNTMVFLYYDLTGNPPPLDSWVEKDSRIVMTQAIDRAAMRQTVRSELESGLASVRDVGLIRISLSSADLSDYDPTYGEFTIGALAPSSEIPFDAFGQKVKLKFANGRTAQIWKVPPAEAQLIRDKLVGVGGAWYNVGIDLLLRIKSVQPGPAGGTIVTDILEYEIRDTRNGTTINRATVAS